MDNKQFFIDNKEAIEAIKKRAKIRALNIFAGVNLLSAWMFGDGFYVLLPFTILAGFIIYSYTKQLFLHQQFPDKFERPKASEDTEAESTENPLDTARLGSLNPISVNYWAKDIFK